MTAIELFKTNLYEMVVVSLFKYLIFILFILWVIVRNILIWKLYAILPVLFVPIITKQNES